MHEPIDPPETDSQITPDPELRDRVQRWLLGEGWQLSEKQHADADWLLEARDTAGRNLVIGQKGGRLDQVLLEGAVLVSDQHRLQLSALPAPQRQELLWDLRFTLLSLNVEFHGVQEPLGRVMIGQRIYLDGLTKDRFLQRVSRVRNGVLAVIWTVSRHLQLRDEGMSGESTGVN